MGEIPRPPEEEQLAKEQQPTQEAPQTEKTDLVEATKKWAERQRRIKEGDSQAIAEQEEEKQAMHKKIWGEPKKKKTPEEQATEISEKKKEISKINRLAEAKARKEMEDMIAKDKIREEENQKRMRQEGEERRAEYDKRIKEANEEIARIKKKMGW